MSRKKQHTLKCELPAEKVLSDEGKPSEYALLVEYSTCEQYVDSAATRDWQVAGIIWGAALAGLFFVVYMGTELSLATLVILTSIYPFLIASIWLFWQMVKRMVFFQIVCRERMRQIEVELGMRKDIYLYLLDNWARRNETNLWERLPQDTKDYLQKMADIRKEAPRPTTSQVTLVINWIITGAWSVLIVMEWLAYLKIIN